MNELSQLHPAAQVAVPIAVAACVWAAAWLMSKW